MASNVPLHRVRQLVLPYLCDQVKISPAAKTMKEVFEPIETVFERWGGLLRSLTGDGESAQADAILDLQKWCSGKTPKEAKWFALFLKAMYDEDIVTEEAIVAWFKHPQSRTIGDEMGKIARESGKKYLESLMEEDDDDEDE